MKVQGRSDKYLASPADGATIASVTVKFKSNRGRNLVLTLEMEIGCRLECKNGKIGIPVGESTFDFGREIAKSNQKVKPKVSLDVYLLLHTRD